LAKYNATNASVLHGDQVAIRPVANADLQYPAGEKRGLHKTTRRSATRIHRSGAAGDATLLEPTANRSGRRHAETLTSVRWGLRASLPRKAPLVARFLGAVASCDRLRLRFGACGGGCRASSRPHIKSIRSHIRGWSANSRGPSSISFWSSRPWRRWIRYSRASHRACWARRWPAGPSGYGRP